MNKINELGKEKYFANRGVARNKTPLPNIRYRVFIQEELNNFNNLPIEELNEKYKDYKFKDLGYLFLDWTNKPDVNGQTIWFLHGLIKPSELKEKLGEKQYSKFCQGKREFIIQRRIDGKNISI